MAFVKSHGLDLVRDDDPVRHQYPTGLGSEVYGSELALGVDTPDLIVGDIALFIHDRQQEFLPHIRRPVEVVHQFAEIEGGSLRDCRHPPLARRLVRRTTSWEYTEIERVLT